MAPTIILINADDMKLVLDISAKIRSNYFGLIDVPDHSTPAATTHHLHAAPVLPTTAAAFLPPSSTIRVSTHQMTGIRASVWFTKLVLEKQEKEEKKKKKRKKKDNDDDEDNNDDN
ncbi:uncharacterized protein CIMG_12618 [Coccidioides immitis RS]|uniref:Uncharacterized protein n=1 Tax=Coccidioides immitis (strain RS) TaxID=246410 RepID=J3KM91_COCIM|nr:uncharacterized protein CIMG_12618 [Coccidioides immitis RS]EAS37500.3 hypothetical protein CIMG_12618 [Coccidioides immitis RS]